MLRILPLLLAAIAALSGCATTRAARRAQDADLRLVLDQALLLLGEERVRLGQRPYRSDCSGFVTCVYDAAGIGLADDGAPGRSGTERIYRALKARRRIHRDKVPRPGDLAFFHDTWDSNGNGLRDDRFTHVALVERVEDDGTVHLVHFASGVVKRDVMNLKHPSQARDPATGRPWNGYLRKGSGRVLAGQLFFRFGRPLPR